jgi:hypothetical protein
MYIFLRSESPAYWEIILIATNFVSTFGEAAFLGVCVYVYVAAGAKGSQNIHTSKIYAQLMSSEWRHEVSI